MRWTWRQKRFTILEVAADWVRWSKLQSFLSSFFVMLQAESSQNQLMLHRVIQKVKMAHIFETQCIAILINLSTSE